MTLDDVVQLIGGRAVSSTTSIVAVAEDSRRVTPGALFAAVQGDKTDGHDYVPAAAAAGAVAVLGNRQDLTEIQGMPYVYCDQPRRATALIAHALADYPTRRQCVLGVTGTNGKTSIARLVQGIVRQGGLACANFGTLGYDLDGEFLEAAHTTPFGADLADLFAKSLAKGIEHVVMEASSHALAQGRVAGIDFNAAALTNLTQDHLDFHGTMEAYLQAKLRLFEMVREGLDRGGPWPRFGVVNIEDPCAGRFMSILPNCCFTYGVGGDVRAEAMRMNMDGSVFRLVSPWGGGEARTHLVGAHNVRNVLCAVALCAGIGVPMDLVLAGLESVSCVPGRFEAVRAGQDFLVVVDYAHTDDGLRNALQAARAVCKGAVIVVFGCGGDRDKGKRPKMGAVAAELADYVVITSDNPRTEEPCRILLDIEVGLQHAGKRKGEDYNVVESRGDAIAAAIERARPGDLVLIAGKGHENYQIVGSERRHFDDREAARTSLKGRLS